MVLRLKPLLPPLFEPYDHDLRKLIYLTAKKYNIRVYDLVLNHSHMHATLLLPNRDSYKGFIREVTSLITQHFSLNFEYLGVKIKKVLTHRPFTRFVHWGKSFSKLKNYMRKNELESGVVQQLWNSELGKRLRNARPNSAQLTFAGLAPPENRGFKTEMPN